MSNSIEQCEAARDIREAFGVDKATGYLIGEKSLNFVQASDIPYILYTSGTTSTPKGVQLQHFGLIENMFAIGERQHLGRTAR